jgi:hypothetical protein
MLHITSFILSAFLAYTVYGWPPSTDLPPDDMPFSVCNLAESETQAISDTLKQIIQNDFNDENSAIAQL